jgi:hypothetical protein
MLVFVVETWRVPGGGVVREGEGACCERGRSEKGEELWGTV